MVFLVLTVWVQTCMYMAYPCWPSLAMVVLVMVSVSVWAMVVSVQAYKGEIDALTIKCSILDKKSTTYHSTPAPSDSSYTFRPRKYNNFGKPSFGLLQRNNTITYITNNLYYYYYYSLEALRPPRSGLKESC